MKINKVSLDHFNVEFLLESQFDVLTNCKDNNYPDIVATGCGWEWLADDVLLVRNNGPGKKKVYLFETSDNILIIFQDRSKKNEYTYFGYVLEELWYNLEK